MTLENGWLGIFPFNYMERTETKEVSNPTWETVEGGRESTLALNVKFFLPGRIFLLLC